MKRWMSIFLALVMLLAMTGCERTAEGAESTTPPIQSERDYDASDPDAVLGEITDDFEGVTSQIAEKLSETFTAVGSTYGEYQENKGLIDEWVALALSESDALFARTKENSITYFKLIAANEDHIYSEFCDDALDEYYGIVYEDAMDEYYDALYDDAMDDLYDEYYDGVIDDAYDELYYDQWQEARSESYEIWRNARSAIYEKWRYERSYIYGLRSAIRSAFCYNDNFDVDTIVAEYDVQMEEEDAKAAEEAAKVYVDFEVLYEINEDGDAEVVGFSGEGNRITISSEYEGEDVVRIADSAFEDCTMLESIILWADLEEIGSCAFKGCTGLTEFSVPSDTDVIGSYAFAGCSNLEDLILWGDPDIGEYAFADCVCLSAISIGSDTKYVGAHAFEGCTSVTSLIIWGAEIIGDYAFAGCTGIEDISIPSEVLSIGNHAFDGCTALSYAFVWGDDTAIGESAFANCPNLEEMPAARGTVLEYTAGDLETVEDDKGVKSVEETTEESADEETAEEDATDPNMVSPEFKEMMDSYEAFFDEYIEFMESYDSDTAGFTTMLEYADMVAQYAEMVAAMEKVEDSEMTEAELAYYLEVSGRIYQKLLSSPALY